ncbi:MAG: hypothetical protein K0B10_13455 [Vicingaceae bacterium]|nr:hypothetical protein [Vicingaceae bacterium]
MQTKWKIVLFFFFAILLTNCKKDAAIHPKVEDECINFPPSSSPLGYQYQQPEITYNAPCFNPNNPNEIIFVRGYYSTQSNELVKYNLITKNETVLLSSTQIWGHPNWGINGWILLNKGDNQVWKIKDNGDSLTQLTTQFGIDAIWSPNGNEFAYWVQIGSVDYTFFSDINGNVLDTLLYPNIAYQAAWSPDGSKIATLGLSYINLNTKQTISVHTSLNPPYINSVGWLSDSETIIWSSNDGFYKTNINTNTTTRIKTACSSKKYIRPTVFNNKIIIQRFDSKLISENIIWTENNLYMMDADGNNETKLTLP